jgi:6-phosphogluconolactonase
MALPPSVSAHATPEQLADALGRYVAAAVAGALARHGQFVVALSGGSLPKTLAAALQAAARAGLALHTEAWHVFYADERCVPLADPDSNHAACRAAVFDQAWFAAAAGAAQLHPIDPALPPAACAVEYAAQIRGVLGGDAGLPQFDLVLLGMGPDGHTASLFPGARAHAHGCGVPVAPVSRPVVVTDCRRGLRDVSFASNPAAPLAARSLCTRAHTRAQATRCWTRPPAWSPRSPTAPSRRRSASPSRCRSSTTPRR